MKGNIADARLKPQFYFGRMTCYADRYPLSTKEFVF